MRRLWITVSRALGVGAAALLACGCVSATTNHHFPTRQDPPNFTADYAIPYQTLGECIFDRLQNNGYSASRYTPLPTLGKASINYDESGDFFMDILRLGDGRARVVGWNADLGDDLLGHAVSLAVQPCAAHLTRHS